jgi:hypothetical protein
MIQLLQFTANMAKNMFKANSTITEVYQSRWIMKGITLSIDNTLQRVVPNSALGINDISVRHYISMYITQAAAKKTSKNKWVKL